MKKLKLDPDSLCIESFQSTPAPKENGTVPGYAATQIYSCWPTCGTTVLYTACNGYDCL